MHCSSGTDIILESIGGEIFEENFECLATFGRYIIFGSTRGPGKPFEPRRLMSRSQTMTGIYLPVFDAKPELIRQGMKYLVDQTVAHSERELERALTERVGAFLQEMGNMFAFVGSQYKIQVGERDFFIDLLLYHRQLRALVALELKIGEFEPEYIGKMQFYLSVLDDTVRLPEEQPSIGIILCKSKDRLIVEYALKDATLPIGVSSYSVTPDVPSRLQGQLPSADQIASLLAGID